MKTVKTVLLTIGILFFGIIAIKHQMGGYDAHLFSELYYIPNGLLFFLTILSLYWSSRDYKKNKHINRYLVSLAGMAFSSVVLFKIIQRSVVDSAQTVLKVSNLAGANNIMVFEFKNNGKFSVSDVDLLGQTIYYGSYRKNKDTITILDSNYEGTAANFPQTGIIVKDTVYWKGFDIMLIDKRESVQQ